MEFSDLDTQVPRSLSSQEKQPGSSWAALSHKNVTNSQTKTSGLSYKSWTQGRGPHWRGADQAVTARHEGCRNFYPLRKVQDCLVGKASRPRSEIGCRGIQRSREKWRPKREQSQEKKGCPAAQGRRPWRSSRKWAGLLLQPLQGSTASPSTQSSFLPDWWVQAFRFSIFFFIFEP